MKPAHPVRRARAWAHGVPVLRRAKKAWPRPYARATAPLRLKPAFLMIGEMKCGTTSLFTYLLRHPQIREPFMKEPFFFDLNYDRGLNYYRSLFPPARGGGVTFEATTYYMAHPLARERIKAFVPDAKLIVLLRDPVERTQSHYHHSRSKGREPLDFEAALDAEPQRLAGEIERIVREPGYRSFAHLHLSYATRSRYAVALRPWLEDYPAEQLLVLAAEELFERPAETVERVLRFLELPVLDLAPYPVMNAREYDRMAPATRERLTAQFAEPNERLYELLGRDLGWARPT